MIVDRPQDALSAGLAELLPAAIRRTLDSYHAYALAEAPPPDDAKAFTAHHAACRAALVHLDALAKLLRWVEDAGTAAGQPGDLEALVAAARRGLDAAAIAQGAREGSTIAADQDTEGDEDEDGDR